MACSNVASGTLVFRASKPTALRPWPIDRTGRLCRLRRLSADKVRDDDGQSRTRGCRCWFTGRCRRSTCRMEMEVVCEEVWGGRDRRAEVEGPDWSGWVRRLGWTGRRPDRVDDAPPLGTVVVRDVRLRRREGLCIDSCCQLWTSAGARQALGPGESRLGLGCDRV